MTFKKILLFGAILLALVMYVRYVEMPKQEEEQTKDRLVRGISATEIETLTVANASSKFTLKNSNPHPKPVLPDEEEVDVTTFKADNTSWTLTEIPHAILDAARINALTSAIETLESSSRISANEIEGDLNQFGLNPPEVTLEFSAKGAPFTLRLGKKNEFLGKRYVQVAGSTDLFLVNETLFEASSKPLEEFRDKSPVGFGDDSVTALTVRTEKDEFTVEKKGTEWRVVQPNVRASPTSVFDLFRNLRNLQTQSYIDDPSVERHTFGLTAPRVRITLARQEGPLTLDIGESNKKFYLQVNSTGTIYELTQNPFPQVPRELSAYRERKFLGIDSFLIQRIKISAQDRESFILAKKDDEWNVDGTKADQPFVKSYTDALESLLAVDFLNGPPDSFKASFEPPLLRVEITAKNVEEMSTQDTTTVLLVGKEREAGYLAMVEGAPEVYVISKDAFKAVSASRERFTPTATPVAAPSGTPST